LTIVVDTSVVVNALITQRFTAAAEQWIEVSTPILAPEFLRIELANTLWKVEKAGYIDQRESDEAWRHIMTGRIRFLPDMDYLDNARRIARRLNHPIYDCLYLAVSEAHDATLVTADRRLYQLSNVDGSHDAGTFKVNWIEDDPPSFPRS
jgi:predicted nucleic acid-binding protein